MNIKHKHSIYILLSLAVIIVLTGTVFSPVANLDFIAMDDSYYVTDNEIIKELSVENFFDSFHTTVAKNIQPLTVLSLSIDYHFWGLNASAYHVHNLILHILNSLLVFFFIYLLSKRKLFLALLTSILFAIHPLHVESVAWISERKDVLYAFYYIAGLISYLLYYENKKANFLVITYFLFFLSLLSKPTAVSFPVILIIIDYYLNGKFTIKSFSSKALFFLFSFIFGLINLKSQGVLVSGFSDFALYQKVIYSSYNVIFYISHFFFPFKLSMFHDTPISIPLYYYIYTIITFLLVIYTIYAIIKKKHKIIVFGILFFISSLFLTLHIVAFSRAIVAERYTYLPYIGLAYSFLYIVFYFKNEKFRHIFNKKYLTWIISISVIFIFSFMSYSYIKDSWYNSETIWSNTIDYYPDSQVAYDSRSNYYLRNDQPKEALNDIKNSLRIFPGNSYALISLAYYYYYIDEIDSVFYVSAQNKNIASFKREFTELKGMAYLKENKYTEALACYDSLIFNYPYDYKFRTERGKINLELNLFSEAVEDFSTAICSKPDSSECYFYRAVAYSKTRRFNKAISDFNSVKDKKNQTYEYYTAFGECYQLFGDSIKAIELFEKALFLKQNSLIK